jgi:hypothetical protein
MSEKGEIQEEESNSEGSSSHHSPLSPPASIQNDSKYYSLRKEFMSSESDLHNDEDNDQITHAKALYNQKRREVLESEAETESSAPSPVITRLRLNRIQNGINEDYEGEDRDSIGTAEEMNKGKGKGRMVNGSGNGLNANGKNGRVVGESGILPGLRVDSGSQVSFDE